MCLYRFRPFEFDSTSGRLRKHGLRIKLQPKPQTLLTILLEEPGQTVLRQHLYQRLWPDGTHVDFDQGLSVAVKKLRDALSDTTDDPKYISTVPGLGYRFIGDVEKVDVPGTLPPTNPEELTRRFAPVILTSSDEPFTRSLGNAWQSPLRGKALAGAVGAVLVAAIFLLSARSLPHADNAITRSLITAPPGWQLLTTQDIGGSIALSPDGTRAVYGASHPKFGSMLLLRKLDSLTAEPIPGTEGGSMPFWSPDGKRIGFFSDQTLKTLDPMNGSPHTVCSFLESARGGTWASDDTILFASSTRGPILRVQAAGGQPRPVTELAEGPYTTHRWPEILPDGNHFLFLAANHDPGAAARPAVFLGSLDGHPARFLVESDSNALFVAGRLLFMSGGKLLSRVMDPSTGELGRMAAILTENLEYDHSLWHAAFAATPQLLIFRERSQTPAAEVIKVFDDSGTTVKVAGRLGRLRGIAVSPDGKGLAAVCDDPDVSICLIHPDGTETRISEAPINYSPVWASDGTHVAYGAHRSAGRFSVVMKDAIGQDSEQVLMESEFPIEPTAWSADHATLLIHALTAKGKAELLTLQLSNHHSRHFLSGDFNVGAGKFSPDGKWVAYQSDQSGRDEIYLASYPDASLRRRISDAGGHAPRWGANRGELYFLDSADTIQRVRLAFSSTIPKVASTTPLFRPPLLPTPYDSESFDVFPQQHLFAVIADASSNDASYVLATSWKH